jgi:hypothetical protein
LGTKGKPDADLLAVKYGLHNLSKVSLCEIHSRYQEFISRPDFFGRLKQLAVPLEQAFPLKM